MNLGRKYLEKYLEFLNKLMYVFTCEWLRQPI